MSGKRPLPRRKHRPLTPLLLLCALALTACDQIDSLTRDAALDGTVAPIVSAQCPTNVKDVEDSSFPSIASGRAPLGFDATTVVSCSVDTDAGAEEVTTYTVTVQQGRMTDELAKALELPDREFVRPAAGACTADGVVLPLLLVTDGNGHAYRPRLPVTECGKPRAELQRALAGLSLSDAGNYTLDETKPR